MAILFKKTMFKNVEEIPFVMELPPYRLPTMKSVLIHMWHNAEHYIVKMGTVVLLFSVILWFAGKYPENSSVVEKYKSQESVVMQSSLSESEKSDSIKLLNIKMNSELQEYTALGKMGKAVEPLVKPFGTDWHGAVALITGFVAKEVVISSMGVLYSTDESRSLKEELPKHFTKLSAIAFMFFVLLYTPCVVALTTLIRELKSWKWSLFSIIYQPTLAWLVATVVFQVGRLLGF
jgi:ferrous iron transport protein B